MDIKQIALKVNGMSCQHCVASIKKALKEVETVEIDLQKKLVDINYYPDQITEEEIIEIIEDEGYEVEK